LADSLATQRASGSRVSRRIGTAFSKMAGIKRCLNAEKKARQCDLKHPQQEKSASHRRPVAINLACIVMVKA
jgi:hypothetical protein